MDDLERLKRAMPDVPGLRPEARTACKEALMEMIEEETGAAATVPPGGGLPRATARSKRRRRWLSAAAVVAVLAVGVTAALQLTSDEVASAALRYGSGALANGASDPAEPMLLRYEGTVSQWGKESPAKWCFSIATTDEGEISYTGGVGGVGLDASDLEQHCSHPIEPPTEALVSGSGEALDYTTVGPEPGGFASPVVVRLPEDEVSPGDSWDWDIPLSADGEADVRWQCTSTLVSLVDDVAEITSACDLGERSIEVVVPDLSVLDEGEVLVLTGDDNQSSSTTTCTVAPRSGEERFLLDLDTGLVTEYDGTWHPGSTSCPEGSPAAGLEEGEMPTVVSHAELADVVPLSEAG